MSALKAGGTGALYGLSTGIISGTVQAYKDARPYKVYQGFDERKEAKYVGITERDPSMRFNEHLKSETERANLNYRVNKSYIKTKIDARIKEQQLINKFGLKRNGGQLYNKINSIAPKYWNQYRIKK